MDTQCAPQRHVFGILSLGENDQYKKRRQHPHDCCISLQTLFIEYISLGISSILASTETFTKTSAIVQEYR